MDRLLRKFRDMKREKLFLYFVVGIYLVYTAWSILRALVSGGAERPALLLVFGLVFAVFGLGLLLICGWALLRAYYLRLYLAELEEQQAMNGDADPETPRPEKEKTGAEKYLDFMYRLFKIKQ